MHSVVTEDRLEMYTGHECSGAGNNGLALICLCVNSALQAVLAADLLQFMLLVIDL